MTANECWQAGDLPGAIAAATQAVKSKPTDVGSRSLLAQLLCFTGEFERADTHLEAAITQEPKAALLMLLRQLIRGAVCRQEVFEKGRIPDFITLPGPALEETLRGVTCLREGDTAGAAAAFAAAEAARVPAKGTSDGQPFEDFRDLDDRLATAIEVITSTGKYLWLSPEQVASLKFKEPAAPWELLWRPAEISVRNGPDGEVYLPCLYPGSSASTDNALRLGRATDWSEGAVVLGVGGRMILVGEDAKTLDDLHELTFEGPPEATAQPEAS